MRFYQLLLFGAIAQASKPSLNFHVIALTVDNTLPEKSYVKCQQDIVTCPVAIHFNSANEDLVVYDKVRLTFGQENQPEKSILIGLFNKEYPYTTRSFYENAAVGNYNNVPMHRIIPNFMAQGGDFTDGTGVGGRGYFATKFDDEKVQNRKSPVPHMTRGMVSMANAGPNTNGSQFFITFTKTAWLDGKHTVFGYVLEDNQDALGWLERTGAAAIKAGKPIKIIKSEVTSVDPTKEPFKRIEVKG